MVVTITISILVLISIFIPRNYLKRYYILAAFVISSLYLFVDPTESDLTRLYGLVDAIKSASVRDIIFLREGNYGNYFLNLYMGHYMIFNLYAKLMSNLPRALFVFIPSLIMYLLPIKLVFDEERQHKYAKWIYVFSYSAFLMCIDFLSISAIRNIVVSYLFCFILYYDLTGKVKKVYCFAGYLLLNLIHSYAVFLLMIRLIIMISNKYTKYFIVIFVAAGYGFLVSENSLVTNLLSRSGFLSYALGRLNHYTDYIGTVVESRRMYILIIYILILITFALANHFIAPAIEEKKKKYVNSMFDYLLFSTIFSIGSYAQYDTFIRGTFIVFPVWILLMQTYLSAIGGRRFGLIRCKNGENPAINMVVYFSSFAIVLLLFFYLARTGYDWMDSWFL